MQRKSEKPGKKPTAKRPGVLATHPDPEGFVTRLADSMGLKTRAERDDLRERLTHDIHNLADFLGFTPEMVTAVEEMALAQYAADKLDQASQTFALLASLDPERSAGYRGLGACCQAQGAYAQAAACYGLAIAVDNTDLVAHFLAGECLCESGDGEGGLSLLRDACASAGRDAALRPYVQRAKRYLSRSAKELEQAATQRHAQAEASRTALAESQARAPEPEAHAPEPDSRVPGARTRQSEAVASPQDDATRASPRDDAAAALARASAPVADGDAPMTAAALEAFLADNLPLLGDAVRSRRISLKQLGGFTDAQMDACYAVACHMLEAGRPTDAMTEVSWLVWLEPRNGRNYELLGLCLHHLGWYCMAEYFYEWALIYDPKNPATLIYRGEAKILSDEAAEGIALVQDGLALAGNRHEFAEVAQRGRQLLQHAPQGVVP